MLCIVLVGIWIPVLFQSQKNDTGQNYFYMSDLDIKTPTPILTHPVDSFVIHIDDDIWIHLYSEEYRDKKKIEIHNIETKK